MAENIEAMLQSAIGTLGQHETELVATTESLEPAGQEIRAHRHTPLFSRTERDLEAVRGQVAFGKRLLEAVASGDEQQVSQVLSEVDETIDKAKTNIENQLYAVRNPMPSYDQAMRDLARTHDPTSNWR